MSINRSWTITLLSVLAALAPGCRKDSPVQPERPPVATPRDAFWQVIEGAGPGHNEQRFQASLEARLQQMDPRGIINFERQFLTTRPR